MTPTPLKGDWNVCHFCGTGSPGGNAHAGDCASLPKPKEGTPNHGADRKVLNKIVNEAWDKRQEGQLTLKECKSFFRVIAAPCVSSDRGAQKRVLDLHQGLAEEAMRILTDSALERDEKRRAALETDIKGRDLKIEKLSEALDALKVRYDIGEGKCSHCGALDSHDCDDNCVWRQAAFAILSDPQELLDALTPTPKEKDK